MRYHRSVKLPGGQTDKHVLALLCHGRHFLESLASKDRCYEHFTLCFRLPNLTRQHELEQFK